MSYLLESLGRGLITRLRDVFESQLLVSESRQVLADRAEQCPTSLDAQTQLGCAALADDGFQRFLRDQVNRQIIRDYLTNAVVLGVISEGGLAAFAPELETEEGRAVLSLYMLMSSVEEAMDLPVGHGEVVSLKPLRPEGGDRSHIKLVPNS